MFRTAWIVDEQNGEEYQIAVGFIESSNTLYYPDGNPDGLWNPSTDVRNTGEYLILFDTPYDQNGGQIELTGGEFQTGSGPVTLWTDLVRWYDETRIPFVPVDAQGITDEQRAIFNSSFLSTMYFLGLVPTDSAAWFAPGDASTIPSAASRTRS